ncbi:hypothetical protein LARV_00472 [Longilinea arvoryzae]|uniref:Uncharacterized protein n=1 Tax=Longilinea arvoryzae TaxID=360412 RepID=A0A0S7BD62_9CHLR|nr:hypothetical protein [Longilinea arvoryzae]GAP12736.1 hypothetical protein LARV_00472 [Longilinea arvoryzae]
MRLEIPQAISLVLALPAHRSNNSGHQKFGEKIMDFLFEYRTLGENPIESQFNNEMISVISAYVRAFSVERDRIADVWKSIESKKKKKDELLENLRNLSPLSKGNYWVKAVVAGLGILGISLPTLIVQIPSSWIYYVIGFFFLILFSIEVLSILIVYFLVSANEEKRTVNRNNKWESESINNYKKMAGMLILEAIDLHLKYFPSEKEYLGYCLEDPVQVEKFMTDIIEKKFCY